MNVSGYNRCILSLSEKKTMRKEAVDRAYVELARQVRNGGPFELKVAIARLMDAAAQLPKPY
jgi:hypothetical protein